MGCVGWREGRWCKRGVGGKMWGGVRGVKERGREARFQERCQEGGLGEGPAGCPGGCGGFGRAAAEGEGGAVPCGAVRRRVCC